MRRTKDQRDLEQVLGYAQEAQGAAYDLFRRRLDTQRNVNSFILLRDALIQLKEACELIERSIELATELKPSDQNSVMDEIGVRSGMLIVATNDEIEKRHGGKKAAVLPFPGVRVDVDRKDD